MFAEMTDAYRGAYDCSHCSTYVRTRYVPPSTRMLTGSLLPRQDGAAAPVGRPTASGAYRRQSVIAPLSSQIRQPLSLPEPPPRPGKPKCTGLSEPSGSHNQPRTLPQPRAHAYINMDARDTPPRPALSLAGAVLSLFSLSQASPSHPRAFFVVQFNTSHLREFEGVSMSTSAECPTTPSRGAGASNPTGEHSGTYASVRRPEYELWRNSTDLSSLDPAAATCPATCPRRRRET